MPMSATGNSWGFTLVETLVVLVIIGLLASVVTLAMPDRRVGAREEARTLAARATLGAQESILSSTPIGLVLTPQGYSFSRWRAGRWTPVPDDKTFASRTWGEGLEVIYTESKARPVTGRTKPPILPAVVFQSSGIATPFKVTLTKDREVWAVSGNERGEIAVAAVTP